MYLSALAAPRISLISTMRCYRLRTSMTPEKLLTSLLTTETEMGRKRLHWGERCIDLDLLAYEKLRNQLA